jgi:hypothetical protein
MTLCVFALFVVVVVASLHFTYNNAMQWAWRHCRCRFAMHSSVSSNVISSLEFRMLPSSLERHHYSHEKVIYLKLEFQLKFIKTLGLFSLKLENDKMSGDSGERRYHRVHELDDDYLDRIYGVYSKRITMDSEEDELHSSKIQSFNRFMQSKYSNYKMNNSMNFT